MENTYYCFRVDYAQKFGLEEAIMMQNFVDWIIDNKDNKKYQHDGKTWITIKKLLEIFPFWTEKQIRRVVQSLIEQGILISNNHKETAFDRTIWYTLKNEEEFINKINHFPKRENGNTDELSNKINHFPKWEYPFSQMGTSNIPKWENGNGEKLSNKINDSLIPKWENRVSQMGKLYNINNNSNINNSYINNSNINNNNLNINKSKGKEKDRDNNIIFPAVINSQVSDENFGSSFQKLPDVIFNVETMSFKGIENYLQKWKEVYRLIDVETEIKKAEAWVISQPKTKWKKNWKRFITNWLAKAEEWAERRKSFTKKSNYISPEDFIRSYDNDK